MQVGLLRLEAEGLPIGGDGRAQLPPAPLHQPQAGPAECKLRRGRAGLAAEVGRLRQELLLLRGRSGLGRLLQQQPRQVEPRRQGDPGRQGQGQCLAVEAGGQGRVGGRFGQGQVQQQFKAFRQGFGAAVLQTKAQQGPAPLQLPCAHQQAAQLGAGVGVSRVALQVGFHRLAQPGRLVTGLQQLRPVAVVAQGGDVAIGDPPVSSPLQQGQHAVVDHRVIRPAPADGRVAAKQTAHPRVGRLAGPPFQAQQVHHQQIRLGHQLPQGLAGLRQQLLIGIEHQHPLPLHEVEGRIAGRGEVAGPVQVVHHRAAAFGDRHGAIVGAGVDDHHLVHEIGH